MRKIVKFKKHQRTAMDRHSFPHIAGYVVTSHNQTHIIKDSDGGVTHIGEQNSMTGKIKNKRQNERAE
jgi:hypothetical protein